MNWFDVLLLGSAGGAIGATIAGAVRAHREARRTAPRGIEATGGGPFDGTKFRTRGTPPPGWIVPVVAVEGYAYAGARFEQAGDPVPVGVYVCQHRGRWWRRRVIFVWQPGAPQDMHFELVGGGDDD